MKRISILLFSSALLLSSCNTMIRTARTAEVGASLQSATVVDLTPATEHRITHTLEPSKAIRRGGMTNIRQAVESEALTKYGNADVLLEPQYVVSKRWTLFGPKVTSITVSGRPAYYTNFRALDDSVWCNPVFRGVNTHQRSLPLSARKNFSKKISNSYESAYRSKGFAMYLSPFVGSGVFECEHQDSYGTSAAGFVSLGYQLNPHIFLGVGIGVNGMGGEYEEFHGGLEGTYYPLFANARFNLSKKKNTLFFDVKYGFGMSGDTGVVGEGPFAGLSVGYSFGRIDIAYQYIIHSHDTSLSHSYYNRYDGYRTEWYDETVDFMQNGISIGFRF